MVRTPSRDKSGLRKGTWTPEEDKKLVAYVSRYGCWNWRLLPKFAGLERCGKSCRLRWLNYLRPDIKRGDYTQEEEDIIIRLHQKLGNKWSVIASNLPGRTDNEIKNHWHTALKKRFEHSPNGIRTKTGKAKASKSKNHHDSPTLKEDNNNNQTDQRDSENCGSNINIGHDTCALSPQPSSSGFSCVTTDTEAARTLENNISVLEGNEELGFLEAYYEPVSPSFWTEPYLTDVSYVPPSEATVPMVYEPHHEIFSPICDVDFWSDNTGLYQECGALFY